MVSLLFLGQPTNPPSPHPHGFRYHPLSQAFQMTQASAPRVKPVLTLQLFDSLSSFHLNLTFQKQGAPFCCLHVSLTADAACSAGLASTAALCPFAVHSLQTPGPGADDSESPSSNLHPAGGESGRHHPAESSSGFQLFNILPSIHEEGP